MRSGAHHRGPGALGWLVFACAVLSVGTIIGLLVLRVTG